MKPSYVIISPKLQSTLYLVLCLLSIVWASAQTTFTESAAAYNLNLNRAKDGGHAWSDFDLDGDLDVLVLENHSSAKSFLMQNNGAGAFTNVQATLAPGMLSHPAERQAAWGDLNNDGRPDFMIGSHGNHATNVALQIFIQNASGTFGDGMGGTAPITVGRNAGFNIVINPINAEGAGFLDFDGDGDLDIFFDSHNYGIELLRNNYINHLTHAIVNPPAATLFTHITTGNGAGVVQFGLNQFATDGDFGTAADANDDGWVDIFMRKRDENDFFLNQGGLFTNGADLAQAHNSNKGGNGLWDLDNDGDLDAVWTENDNTQIFRNDGPGIWTSLGGGVFPGLPQPANSNGANSMAFIEALAGGDIDNDGDIDILLVGDNQSYLYINQLNSPTPAPGTVGSGTAMTFVLDAQTFNTRDGEGTTMVDIDDDGDLDIYMSINHNTGNQLWINNLPAANRNNHLIVNVTEDRAPDGSTGGFSGRIALGTNVLIRDCDGNIVSGLRQVNGVFGHGTQQPEPVHFGLPLGENQTYLIEVHYPNFYDPVNGTSRLIATGIAQPSLIAGTNHYTLTTTDAESLQNLNAPIANDDTEIVSLGTTVSVQISLFDNDSEPDGDNFFIDSVVQPAIGSVVIDDADLGLVTYTYSAGTPFPGTTFDYTISDSNVSLCPASGLTDTATVTVYEPCADSGGIDSDGDGINDICDFDDDNDGILDTMECDGGTLDYTSTIGAYGTNVNNATYSLWSTDVTYAVTTGGSQTIRTYNAGQNGDAIRFNNTNGGTDMQLDITFSSNIHDIYFKITDFDHNTEDYTVDIYDENGVPVDLSVEGVQSVGSRIIQSGNNFKGTGTANVDGNILANDPIGSVIFNYKGGVSRIHITADQGSGISTRLTEIQYCGDTDGDNIPDHLDLDSDNDGIYDVIEAGHDLSYTSGRLTGAVGLDGVADVIQNSGQEDSGTVNYTVRDSDSDGNDDFVELDSDADGCEDVLEAGFTESGSATGELQGTGYDSTTGLVTGNGNGYTTPADGDTNSILDYREAGNAPAITIQPLDTTICLGCTGSISTTATNADTYQWQLFNGFGWVDLTDSGIYSGSTSNSLTITNPTTAENGNQYRVIVSNSSYSCTVVATNPAILAVAVATVITNRRITYRVNKN